MSAKGTLFMRVALVTAFVIGLPVAIVLLNTFRMRESDAAEVYMEATRPDFQRIPIGVLGFKDKTVPTKDNATKDSDGPARQLAEILKADLRRSQIFVVADVG